MDIYRYYEYKKNIQKYFYDIQPVMNG